MVWGTIGYGNENDGENFIFLDDNTRPHTVRVATQYLADHGIERMDWPSKSPDLNPIEHVWDMMSRRCIEELEMQPNGLQLLGVVLEAVWDAVRDVIRLISSRRQRCQAVIAAGGGHTRY
jgi:transposase